MVALRSWHTCLSGAWMTTGLMLGTLILSDAQAGTLSFEQAQEQLLQRSWAYQAQQYEADAWQQQADATRSLYLPRVEILAAGIRYEKQFEFDTRPITPAPISDTYAKQGIRTQVNATWPLYAGGKIDATRAQAKARHEESRAGVVQRREQLTRDLIRYYFGVQLSVAIVQVRQEAFDAVAAHAHQAERFAQQGLISRLDRLQADVALSEARRDLAKARRDLSNAQAALQSTLVSEDEVCPATPLFINDAPPAPLQELLDSGLVLHSGLAVLTAKDQQAQQQIRIERSQLRPQAFAFTTYELNPDVTPITEPDWIVGIGVRLPLTTDLNRSRMVAAAQLRAAQVSVLTRQAQADIALLISSSYRQLEQAIEQFQLLTADHELAAENARLQAVAYRNQQATSLDVTQSRVALTRSQVQMASAAFDYIQALADLLAASGRLQDFSEYIGGVAVATYRSCGA